VFDTDREGPGSSILVIIPWIVACALFMQSLDATAIATAVPVMATSLGVAPVRLSAAITAYVLSAAVFLPASGWAADRYGSRTIFALAIVIFTGASVVCGAAGDLTSLVLARVLQGIGGSMMVPVGRLVLLRAIPRDQLVSAMARMTMPALVGPALGPLIGGFLATYASWRWIFYVNIPIGILGVILTLKLIPNFKEERHVVGRFDIVGCLLSGIALGTLVFGLESVGRSDASLLVVGALPAIGLVSGTLYLLRARGSANPVLDVSLFRHPTYAACIGGGALFRMSAGAVPFLMPMLLQVGFGLTPLASGSITFASALGAIISKPFTRGLLRRLGFRRLLIGNALLSGVLLAGCGWFRPMTPHALIFAVLLIGGLLRSLQFTYMNTLAFADIPTGLTSRANTLANVMQQLSISVGVATGAAALHLASPASAGTLAPSDFILPFLLVGVLGGISGLLFSPLPPAVGAEMSGHRRRGTLEDPATE
jgi:EmrB/QacA subfamily drug resistance transporter